MRLFFGIPIPIEIQERLKSALQNLRVPLPPKTSRPENWHITLFFFGEVDHETKNRISAMTQELNEKFAPAAFDVLIGGFGAFPNPRAARILFMGVQKGLEPLTKLAEHATQIAEGCGFKREKHKYTPHITLSRPKPPQDVSRWTEIETERISFPIDRFVLYESARDESGHSRYLEIESYKLYSK